MNQYLFLILFSLEASCSSIKLRMTGSFKGINYTINEILNITESFNDSLTNEERREKWFSIPANVTDSTCAAKDMAIFMMTAHRLKEMYRKKQPQGRQATLIEINLKLLRTECPPLEKTTNSELCEEAKGSVNYFVRELEEFMNWLKMTNTCDKKC
ncbi:hypothetical protein NDU88_005545 [Pleurodeles waltl]|uniref:Interleukin-7 n=1 Tax=Pleurodeles waltl TaxID=8319 RepID=A0AAV7PIV7_PLEWA|nr:hypothetical protein NDU88_005545 [Pleurodeles waltl]